jgi:hypothetical protein
VDIGRPDGAHGAPACTERHRKSTPSAPWVLATPHQEVFDDTGLVLETVAERYTDDIMARFARSPEGSAVLKQCDRFGWSR